MKTLRSNIYLIVTIWFCSVVSLDVAIPLHFLVKKHTHITCSIEDKTCCSSSESSTCPICAFDLYIAFPQKFNFIIKRTDVLLLIFNEATTTKTIFKTPLFVQLRAPPSANQQFTV